MDALVSIPIEEAQDLRVLVELSNCSRVDSQPFDGVTLASVLVPLTAATVPVLRAWIVARFEAKKAQSVTFNGVKFEGYDADEVKDLLAELKDAAEKAVSNDEPSP